VSVPGWPGKHVSVPSGGSLYLKAAQARKVGGPDQTRRALARDLVDFVAAPLPTRRMRVVGEGGDATQERLRRLPGTVEGASRMLISGKLSAPPLLSTSPRRGGPPKKGRRLGSPKPLARNRSGWQPPPTETGALVPAWTGRWPTVLPGRLLQVVGVRRAWRLRPRQPGQRQPPPAVEAFFSPDLPLSLTALLAQDRARWAVEIPIRDSNALAGFGQAQWRKRERVGGANTLRLVLAAARTLWFGETTARIPPVPRQRYRPWDRQKSAPSQLDLVWTWRAALQTAGVCPIPRVAPDLAAIPQEAEIALPLAA